MKVYSFSCGGCNNSCPLDVSVENGKVINIEGNCCHRGLVSGERIAMRKIIMDEGYPDGLHRMYCTACDNSCDMEVTVKNQQVVGVNGNGCPMGIKRANQKIAAASKN